ncbi:MAG: hypothetical protein LC808_30430 [Actinobacteria bacterium]|nr:hypothetical protein [Actinomycetota bacterium]
MSGPADAGPSSIAAGEYSYEEAIQLGIPTGPTSDEVGLPYCAPDPEWPGFSSSEEAAAVPMSAATCVVDPRTATYGVDLPIPHFGPPTPGNTNGYHWNGFSTNGLYRGGDIGVEVRNPAVDHVALGDEDEFVVARVLPKTSAGKWLEVGWSEVSWGPDARRVYTFKTATGDWTYYPRTDFPIQDGNYYAFRSHSCPEDACAEIYWGSTWMLLDTAHDHSCFKNSQANCYVEEFAEGTAPGLVDS